MIEGPGARVMSLRDGLAKMSKSDPSDQSRINLLDDADTISQKIRRARTDPAPLPSEVAGLSNRPEAANLVGIYAAMAGISDEQVLNEFGGKGFAEFKPVLADLMVDRLAPVSDRMRRLIAEPAEIDRILAHGAARARAIAVPILEETKRIVGFVNI
jgi:tryptophanyl-tRNA synthetase